MRLRRALVTGGLGFIGSALARRLIEAGWETAVIDSLIEGHGGNRANVADLEGKLEIFSADLIDEAAARRAVAGRDVVFHLAGQRSHVDSMTAPLVDLDLNCRASLSLFEACRREAPRARVVYTSTRQVYGRPESLPVRESQSARPVDLNGVHKLAVEQYLKVYEQAYGLRSCVLRLTNTYGPRMRVADARQGFMGLWFRELLAGRELVIFGDGSQRRDFNYVDDVVEALVRCAEMESALGETLNLGAAPAYSLKEVAQLLVALNGSGGFRLAPFPPAQRALDIGNYAADYSKAAAVLGWAPRVGLSEGLARTLAYFRAHPPAAASAHTIVESAT